MEVILQENIKNLGQIGATVKVKAGYARNYLIPQGKALPATSENIVLVEAKRADLEKSALALLEKAQVRAAALNELSISISANAGEGGKLFGSVGARDVASAIEAAGQAASRVEIDMPDGPIRQLGEYDIKIILHPELSATVKVVVIADESES